MQELTFQSLTEVATSLSIEDTNFVLFVKRDVQNNLVISKVALADLLISAGVGCE